jgi:hypothetical protein
MTNMFQIECSYHAGTSNPIELPEGRTIADIKEAWVKWDTVHIIFNDGTEVEIRMESDGLNAIDWKRPIDVEVFPIAEDGDIDYDNPVTEEFMK